MSSRCAVTHWTTAGAMKKGELITFHPMFVVSPVEGHDPKLPASARVRKGTAGRSVFGVKFGPFFKLESVGLMNKHGPAGIGGCATLQTHLYLVLCFYGE